VDSKLSSAIVGSDATVKAGLEKLVGDTGANELIVVTDTYEHADRLQSYQRVANVVKMINVNPTTAVGF
jgi:alkanesulfonate monooxygenase SsuD/methylene tetrahydromethanopterin reductase-like flavin-dependent oxidoreductase (luciferase family)